MAGTDAKITVGEWNWSDEEALFIKQPADGSILPAIWTDYQIRNWYEKDGHIYMMGCTSPDGFGSQGDTVSFVQLASPTLLWVCDWTAARFAEPPNIPDPDPEDSSWKLMDVHYGTANIIVSSDGQNPLYRISGTYFYGHKKPPHNPFSAGCFPRPPWLKELPARTINSSSLFESALTTLPKGQQPPNLNNPVILNR